jgi:sortase B
MYGNLYFDGKDHGIEFFAFVHADAYDDTVLTVNVAEEKRQLYLDDIYKKSLQKRDIGITKTDLLVLLTTCSAASTNGRDILAGRITEEVFTDPFSFSDNKETGQTSRIQSGYVRSVFPWPLLLLIVAIRLTAPAINTLCGRRRAEKS